MEGFPVFSCLPFDQCLLEWREYLILRFRLGKLYLLMKTHYVRKIEDLSPKILNGSMPHNINSWPALHCFHQVNPIIIYKCTSTILFSYWIIGWCGLISMIFLWFPKLYCCLRAAAYSIRYLFGVGFDISATIVTGLLTSLNDIFTSLMLALSYFFA